MPLFFIEDGDRIGPADKRWTLIEADAADDAADRARHLFWPELCGVFIRDDIPANIPTALELMVGRRFSDDTAKHLMAICGMPGEPVEGVLMSIPATILASDGKAIDVDSEIS